MYMMYMVRKQLYIEERHEKALKRRAKALGVSEADIVREALDALFAEDTARPLPGHREALKEFLARADEIAASRVGAEPVRFRREEEYAKRESRWGTRR